MASLYEPGALPPLPQYELRPLPPLIAPIPDKFLTLLLPIVAYWALSIFFHWIDEWDLFPQYRLHTPAEIVQRNRASRREVIRDVLIQQAIQTVIGAILGLTEPDEFVGKEEFDVAVWAGRIRAAQSIIPGMLAILSIDATGLAKNLAAHPDLARAISGGIYPLLNETVTLSDGIVASVPAFAAWELTLARAVYWVIVPALQITLAIVAMDTWQYFVHRAMHINKWLYTKIHSRHHRLYVPYAFGALYNHPVEAFFMDTLGAAIAFKLAGLTTRQGMLFFTGSTIKTVDDHCGYALPWDPLQHLTSNNAAYHDIHHQSWGIKTNFSQPFFTFWDHRLGTVWTGGDVSVRYERAKLAAQKKMSGKPSAQPAVSAADSTPSTSGSSNTTEEDHRPYSGAVQNATALQTIPSDLQQPAPQSGKAEQQAAASREQVLSDTSLGGGAQVLIAETQEEEREREAQARSSSNNNNTTTSSTTSTTTRRSNRRRTASSLTQSDGLRGLTERVNIHGRTGGILGMDHSH